MAATRNEEEDTSREAEVGRPFQRDGHTIYVCKRCRTSYSGLAAERTIKNGRCFQCQRHEASSLEPIPAGGYGSTLKCTNCGADYSRFEDGGKMLCNYCCDSPNLPWLPGSDTVPHLEDAAKGKGKGDPPAMLLPVFPRWLADLHDRHMDGDATATAILTAPAIDDYNHIDWCEIQDQEIQTWELIYSETDLPIGFHRHHHAADSLVLPRPIY